MIQIKRPRVFSLIPKELLNFIIPVTLNRFRNASFLIFAVGAEVSAHAVISFIG